MSAQPARQQPGINYSTTSSTNDITRRQKGRGRDIEKRGDNRRTFTNPNSTIGNQGVEVTYINPVTVNQSIVTTAERNRKIFEVNKKNREVQVNQKTSDTETINPPEKIYTPEVNVSQVQIKRHVVTTGTSRLKTKTALVGTRIIASIVLALFVLSIYVFGFGLLSLAVQAIITYALTWLPDFLSNFVSSYVDTPGIVAFGFSYIILVIFGLLSLLPFAILYYLTYKKAFSGYSGLALLLAFSLYLVPFLNFLPWWILWVGLVYVKLTVDQIQSTMGQK
jgi:hypothetical protein